MTPPRRRISLRVIELGSPYRWRRYLALYGQGPPFPHRVYFAVPVGRWKEVELA